MKLSVSDDKYEAYLHPELGEPGTQIPVESLKVFLASNGITDTAILEAMETIASEGLPAEDVLVAAGSSPQKGKDGWVEHVFKTPKVEPTGEKDPHPCLLKIYNVRESEVLSILHPPESGIQGKTVFGVAVPSQPGKAARLRIGENVRLSDDKAAIISLHDGGAQLGLDGSVAVDPILRLKEDVGTMTGNIIFFGSIIVLGDVKSEFSLKAENSIEVKGSVGDATIEAGTDVTIYGGYVGTGKGIVRAGGTVRLKFLHHQQVFAQKDIFVESEAIDSGLHAEGKIMGVKAVFIGGSLEAGNEIEVMDLGNGDETNVTVHAGNRPKLLERLNGLEKKYQQIEKQLTEVKAAVYKLIRLQLDHGKLSAEQEVLLGKLKQVQDSMPRDLEANKEEQKANRDLLQNSASARVVVHGTVSANAIIDVNGIKKMVPEPLCGVIFVEKSGKIEQVGA